MLLVTYRLVLVESERFLEDYARWLFTNKLFFNHTFRMVCFKSFILFQYVDSTLSQKILSVAKKQQQELEDDIGTSSPIKQKTVKLGADNSDSEEDEPDNLEVDTFYENIEIDESDEKALEMFMSKNPVPRRTLADIIMEKITEKQTEIQTQFSDAGNVQMQELDPRVTKMYEDVRDVLRKYRSGKLPKAFKIIPNLRNWEQILYITGRC